MMLVRISILIFFGLPVTHCQMDGMCDSRVTDYGVVKCAAQFSLNPFPKIVPRKECKRVECFLECIDEYIAIETLNCTVDEATTKNTFLTTYRALYRYLCDVGELAKTANENCYVNYMEECQPMISSLTETAFALNEAGDMVGFKEESCRISDLMINCAIVNVTNVCTQEMVDFILLKKKIDHKLVGCDLTTSLLIDEYIFPTDCVSDDQNSTLSPTRPNITIDDDISEMSYTACQARMWNIWWDCTPGFLWTDVVEKIEICTRIECRISCFESDPRVQECISLYPITDDFIPLNRLSRARCDRPALYTLAYTYCEIQPCLQEFFTELSSPDLTDDTYCTGPISILRSCVPFSITPDCDEKMIEHATLVLRIDMDVCAPYIWQDLPKYTSEPPPEDACDGSTCVIPRNVVVLSYLLAIAIAFL